jgi:hypothetical protein
MTTKKMTHWNTREIKRFRCSKTNRTTNIEISTDFPRKITNAY